MLIPAASLLTPLPEIRFPEIVFAALALRSTPSRALPRAFAPSPLNPILLPSTRLPDPLVISTPNELLPDTRFPERVFPSLLFKRTPLSKFPRAFVPSELDPILLASTRLPDPPVMSTPLELLPETRFAEIVFPSLLFKRTPLSEFPRAFVPSELNPILLASTRLPDPLVMSTPSELLPDARLPEMVFPRLFDR